MSAENINALLDNTFVLCMEALESLAYIFTYIHTEEIRKIYKYIM